MRLLVLSNTPFLPATAGNRARIDQMLAHLAARGTELAMLMLPGDEEDTWDCAGMAARLSHFEVVRPSLIARARRRLVAAPADPARPIGIDDWCPRWFRERAAGFAAAWRPAAVLVEYVFLSACLDDVRRAAPGALALIDTHDVMHHRAGAYAAVGLAPRWFHTTREEERRGLARADVVLAVQPEEADVFRRMVPERQVLVVPHGRPVDPAPLERAEPDRLLLVASHNDLNVDGLAWFLARVWPGLRAEVPAVELVVCGTIAGKVRDVPAGVSVLGVLPSLADEYARARIVLDPVRGATGIQVKTVDALCHGRPVVATRVGGGLAEGTGVTVAETADDFRTALVRLLRDDALWRRRAAEAGAHARREFSPDAAFAPLVERLAVA